MAAALFRVENHCFGAAAARQQLVAKPREIGRIVTGPKGVDEHFHPAAADEAVVPPVIAVELEREQFGGAVIEHLQRAAFDFGLDAAAAERPHLRAVRKDEHRRTGFLRRRPARFHKSGVAHRPGTAEDLVEFGEDMAHSVLLFVRNRETASDLRLRFRDLIKHVLSRGQLPRQSIDEFRTASPRHHFPRVRFHFEVRGVIQFGDCRQCLL